MLSTMLGRHPDVHAFTAEGNFFEHVESIRGLDPSDRREQIVNEIEFGNGEALGFDDREEIEAALGESSGIRSAEKLYRKGKELLASRNHADRWVQKATSYIFHIEKILDAFPEARLVFLARNPLDLAASVQRRGYFRSHIARTVWGWNVGVRRALDWADRRPSNVQIHRYEDLVQRPDEELREISEFCDFRFSPECLKVPHVNPSEDPYSKNPKSEGTNTSRVFYYPDVLQTDDEMAVRSLVSQELLDHLYPDLPASRGTFRWRSQFWAGALVVFSALDLTRQHMQMLLQNPSHTLRRLKERFFAA